jgi:hypothetical protein
MDEAQGKSDEVHISRSTRDHVWFCVALIIIVVLGVITSHP